MAFGSDYMLTLADDFTEGVVQCLTTTASSMPRRPVDGLPKMSPLWLLKYLPNMPASHIAIYNDLRGPNNSLTLREAVANVAVGEAYQAIARDRAEVMIAGATGTRLHPMKMIHVIQNEELARGDLPPDKACRPFDLNRSGMVLGEGAGALVLEEQSHARRRGAAVFGKVLGGVLGVRRAETRRPPWRGHPPPHQTVLKSSGLTADQIGHIQPMAWRPAIRSGGGPGDSGASSASGPRLSP